MPLIDWRESVFGKDADRNEEVSTIGVNCVGHWIILFNILQNSLFHWLIWLYWVIRVGLVYESSVFVCLFVLWNTNVI